MAYEESNETSPDLQLDSHYSSKSDIYLNADVEDRAKQVGEKIENKEKIQSLFGQKDQKQNSNATLLLSPQKPKESNR